MKKFFSRKILYILAAIIIIVAVFFVFRRQGDSYTYVKASRSDIKQEISVTGKIKPTESVSLSFEQGGRVSVVLANVGDTVKAGQGLAWLDSTVANLELAQAEAALAELVRGTRKEDIAILESKRAAAQADVLQSKQALVDTIKDAFRASDDAVRNYADQFFDNPRSVNPTVNIQVNDFQLKIDLNTMRSGIENVLLGWEVSTSAVSRTSDLSGFASGARKNLDIAKAFLDKLAFAVNMLSSNQSLPATTINTYRSNISTARSAVGGALAGLTTDETMLASSIAGLDLAEKNLDLARAGTLPEQIEAQKAKVASIKHAVAVSVLRSPITGTVTRQDAKVGEVVAANQPIVSVISDGNLEIEAFVPEVDIGAMVLRQSAAVSFDAFPEEVFAGTIVYLDPAETVIDGVPTYKIKLSVDASDVRMRPGMTANLSVNVAERNDTLTLPYRAIQGKNGERHVLVSLPSGEVKEIPVVLGIRGVNGEVEIISGLEEGATVAIPVRR